MSYMNEILKFTARVFLMTLSRLFLLDTKCVCVKVCVWGLYLPCMWCVNYDKGFTDMTSTLAVTFSEAFSLSSLSTKNWKILLKHSHSAVCFSKHCKQHTLAHTHTHISPCLTQPHTVGRIILCLLFYGHQEIFALMSLCLCDKYALLKDCVHMLPEAEQYVRIPFATSKN